MPLCYPGEAAVFEGSKGPFLIFYASIDPATGQMWCEDCRAVDALVKKTFEPEDAPTGIIMRVGQVEEWKNPNNPARKQLGITRIPTIVLLKGIKEVARLEEDIADEKKLQAFVRA